MKNICHIVGAGSTENAVLIKRPGDFVIAADAGLSHLESIGVTPDLTVGDFDSLGKAPEGENVIRCPAEKDDTDTLIAVREGLKRGYDVFSIIGGLGGRLDHTFANIQTLAFIAAHGACGFLSDGETVVTAIRNGKISFAPGKSGIASVFCMGSEAHGVYLHGLKYPLSNARLTYDFPIGVSNEFIGSGAEISVEEGTLAVMWQERGFDAGNCGVTFGRLT